jgi:hypothetical protein
MRGDNVLAGLSVHIGLNNVDATKYQGWDGQLRACENDARSMKAIADSRGFKSLLILTKDATSSTVLGAIGNAARELKSGDFFLLTYSGHGGWVPDSENRGKKVDTWVLWDRMVISHELYRQWGSFQPGVRILVTSDSCHSGTVTRIAVERFLKELAQSKLLLRDANLVSMGDSSKADALGDEGLSAISEAGISDEVRIRAMPDDFHLRVWNADQAMYKKILSENPANLRNALQVTVLLISGCQDNQTSADGDKNGLFTAALLITWNQGGFRGDYPSFYKQIVQSMPDTQVPNYFKVGAENRPFEAQEPFTV